MASRTSAKDQAKDRVKDWVKDQARRMPGIFLGEEGERMLVELLKQLKRTMLDQLVVVAVCTVRVKLVGCQGCSKDALLFLF
jgi:hypothetical protein